MDVTSFKTQPYFYPIHSPFQGESLSEDESFNPLLVPTLMPKQEKLQFTTESPTKPTNKSHAPPMEELKVYSRCQKSKIIHDATCHTSDLDLGNTTTIPDTMVNEMNLPITQHKGVR